VVLALIALFVALDGPAAAQRAAKQISGSRLRDNTVTGAKVKNGSVQRQDLSARARNSLKVPGNRTVTEPKLAPNAITSAAVAARAIGTDELADGSVETRQVADGTLTARDVGSFSGQATLDFPSLAPDQCVSLRHELPAGANVADDVVAVTPPSNWLENVPVTEVLGPEDRAFTVTACNVTNAPTPDPGPVNFRFVIFNL